MKIRVIIVLLIPVVACAMDDKESLRRRQLIAYDLADTREFDMASRTPCPLEKYPVEIRPASAKVKLCFDIFCSTFDEKERERISRNKWLAYSFASCVCGTTCSACSIQPCGAFFVLQSASICLILCLEEQRQQNIRDARENNSGCRNFFCHK